MQKPLSKIYGFFTNHQVGFILAIQLGVNIQQPINISHLFKSSNENIGSPLHIVKGV